MAVSRISTLGITLFLLSLNFGLAQGVKTISWKDLNRKDGVYYSLENFLNNQPDIPRDALLDDEHLIILGQWVGSPFNIFYTEIGFMNRYGVKEKIATKMIWAIVQNGYPQIVDQQMRTFSEQRSIYPLKTPGYFMRYTIYNFASERIGFEVFRYEGNFVVEHWDLFRSSDVDELLDPPGDKVVRIIEWADRLPDGAPAPDLSIQISIGSQPEERILEVHAPPELVERFS